MSAMEPKPKQEVCIIVLVDATGSMGSYCSSVGATLQQLFAVLDVLFQASAKVKLVAYEDYCDGPKVLRTCNGQRAELQDFAKALRAGGGGDCPEAGKTALNSIIEDLRAMNRVDAEASKRTLVIHYTDAPPHHKTKVGSDKDNLSKEMAALKGKSPGFDWVQICQEFRQLGTPVISFLRNTPDQTTSFMGTLGSVVWLPDTDSRTITKFTMGVLLQLMGQPFEGLKCKFYEKEWDLAKLNNEDSAEFFAHLNAKMVVEEHKFQPHPAFVRDLRKLPQTFQQSEDFQSVVFAALKELFVGESALAVTYNSVLGELWRVVCRQREDPRVQPLCDALSTCCQSLAGEKQAQLRAWIDESYDQMEEIASLILAVEEPLKEGVLVLDVPGDEMPSKEEMRSIMHAPLPGVLRKVQSLLSRLMHVKEGSLPAIADSKGRMESSVPMYLPLGLRDKDLFSTITHLLLPGLMMSLRPAAMLAIIAYKSGNATLKPRAERFLQAWKGKWIPPIEKVQDYPEILNAEFIRLALDVPEFLTEPELETYKHCNGILRVRRAGRLRLHVKVGFTPSKTNLIMDTKQLCSSCGHRRSSTLMVQDVCGLCLNDKEMSKATPEKDEERSHMVECRTCQALYAVVRIEDLNVAPKCHYCRERQKCPTVSCSLCGNRYVAPSPSSSSDSFVCCTCFASPSSGLPDSEVTMTELIEKNPAFIRCLGFSEEARKAIFDTMGLFKLWTGKRELIDPIEILRPSQLTWAGKPVMNVEEVVEEAIQAVTRGALAETCNLCFEVRALPALQSSCGRCSILACGDCLRKWYGRSKPGCLYSPSEGLCPFCKRDPRASTLRTFNRAACRLAGRKTLQLRADFYYGWCRSCYTIAEAVPRECAQEVPELRNFQCEPCKEKTLLKLLEEADGEVSKMGAKSCPGCKAATVKLSGCNHMTCPSCSAHWCWQCGDAFTAEEIYQHMEEAHGSIGLDDLLDEE